jgi:hypothetical protein
MARSRDSGIKIWFWSRSDSSVPADVAQGGETLSPDSTWGKPAASFVVDPNHCNYDQYFDAHNIIFDLTFCVRAFTILILFASATDVLSSP